MGKGSNFNRNKGVGGNSTRKGKAKKLQSDSESDPKREHWMDAKTGRKKPRTKDGEDVRISKYTPCCLVAKWC